MNTHSHSFSLSKYFDYMGTTPIDPAVVDAMLPFLTTPALCINPNTQSSQALHIKQAIEQAAHQVAACFNCDPQGIIWTSGATESINLAIKGAANFYQRQGKHLITLATEHKAVLQTFEMMETLGYEISILPVEPNGILNYEQLKQAIRPDTLLVSIGHINNETGVIQDIERIAKLTQQRGILLHLDAAQSIGKVHIDADKLGIDLISFSAHKSYGPKGIGALYFKTRPKLHLSPLIHGGGQQQGKRSGTLASHQIVGMGAAFSIAQAMLSQETQSITQLHNQLTQALITPTSNISLNGDTGSRVPHNINLHIENIDPEVIDSVLSPYVISYGANCTHKNIPSHVLQSMGLTHKQIARSRRITLGRFTQSDDITALIKAFQPLIQ